MPKSRGDGIRASVLEVIRETKIFDVQFGSNVAREVLRPTLIPLPTPSSINCDDDGIIELPPPAMPSSEKKRSHQEISAAPVQPTSLGGGDVKGGGEEEIVQSCEPDKKKRSATSVLAETVRRDMNEILAAEQTLLDEDMATLAKIMDSIKNRQETIGKTRRIIAAIEAEET
jgi:hypothetical protein